MLQHLQRVSLQQGKMPYKPQMLIRLTLGLCQMVDHSLWEIQTYQTC